MADMNGRFTTDLLARQSPLNGLAGRTKVAIVGFSDKVHQQAPYNDPEWEIWGFNMANRMDFMQDAAGRFRADRWFDLHPLSVQSPDDLAWIHCCPVPLYLTEPYPANPQAQVYPLLDVRTHYLEYCELPYFASSFAYALVLAMHEGYPTIGLFGVDLDWGRERMVEHGNLAFWAGLARGLGHTVHVPSNSQFLAHPALYGFDYWQEKGAIEARMVRMIFELRHYDLVEQRTAQLTARWNNGEAAAVQRELWGSLMATEDAPIVGEAP